MPTALVTGITGQDGGYLAEQLVADGWTVHGAIRHGEELPQHLVDLGAVLTCSEVDLLDPTELAKLIDRSDPDEVYNLAGVSSVAQSWQEPVLTVRVNAEVVVSLLQLLWQRQTTGRPTRFVQASSAEIFAGAAVTPQNESTPLSPRTPYGAAKACAHQAVQIYRHRGLHAVNAILYNHESPRRPTSFVTRKITAAVAAIASGQQHELVLGNLDARRDWGWAAEYVEGMTTALRHPSPEDWIFATGVSASVGDFAAAAFAHVGIRDWDRYVRVDQTLTRSGDAAELVGDPLKARELLGWEPRTPLPEVVGRMVDAER